VGLYCNNNFEELKRNLKELLNNRKLWKELSENAFNYVFNEMNIEKSIKKWKKIFFYLFSKRYRKKSNLSNR
jgi:glycosyltransferase involved in cell wall biosynthesis